MEISFYTSKNHICNRNSQEVPGLTFSGQGRCKININFGSLLIHRRQTYKQKPGKQSHSHGSKIILWVSLTKVKALHKETLKHQGRDWRRHKMSSLPMHVWFGEHTSISKNKTWPLSLTWYKYWRKWPFYQKESTDSLQPQCNPSQKEKQPP